MSEGVSRIKIAKPEHEATYAELVALLRRHPEVEAIELLAIASNIVGKVLAMQDQRRYTRETAMKVVMINIETGNKQAIDDLMNKTEGRA